VTEGVQEALNAENKARANIPLVYTGLEDTGIIPVFPGPVFSYRSTIAVYWLFGLNAGIGIYQYGKYRYYTGITRPRFLIPPIHSGILAVGFRV
jgi:hypothetical protein